MSKIVRYEFIGSLPLFLLLCLTVVLIPVAVVYLVNSVVRIEHDVEEPEKFVDDFRSGNFKR